MPTSQVRSAVPSQRPLRLFARTCGESPYLIADFLLSNLHIRVRGLSMPGDHDPQPMGDYSRMTRAEVRAAFECLVDRWLTTSEFAIADCLDVTEGAVHNSRAYSFLCKGNSFLGAEGDLILARKLAYVWVADSPDSSRPAALISASLLAGFACVGLSFSAFSRCAIARSSSPSKQNRISPR